MADALQELRASSSTARRCRPAAPRGAPIGRPHLAQAAFDHPANAARIADEGLADFGALLEAYLIPGAPAFRRRTTPTVAEAIEVIHAAGGVAVWAHPFWDLDTDDEVARRDRPLRRARARRRRGLLRHPHREQTLLCADACARARPADHRHRPTSTAPTTRRFTRFRAFDLYGRDPVLGPIA